MRQVSDVVVRPLDEWQVVCWSADSKKVLTKILPTGQRLDQANRAVGNSEPKASREENQPQSEILIYRSSRDTKVPNDTANAPSLLEDSQTKAERADLVVVDVETGQVEGIARGFNPVWYSISPDGSRFAFATWKGLERGNIYRNLFDLLVVVQKEARTVDSDIPRDAWDFSASWSPDGTLLSYVIAGGDADGECYLVSVSGGPRRKAAQKLHPSFNSSLRRPPLWDPSGQHLYLLTSSNVLWEISLKDGGGQEVTRIADRTITSIIAPSGRERLSSHDDGPSLIVSTVNDSTKQCGIYRINPTTGAFARLQEEDKKYDLSNIIYSADTRELIYLAEDVAHESNLWAADSGFTKVLQLTDLNPRMRGYLLGESRLIGWNGPDGQLLHGALLLPSGYQEGKRYPLIVDVYPGVLASNCLNDFGLCASSFFPNKQLFATRGYAVLLPDAPVGVGTFMRDLAQTVLPGVNKAVELGVADPERIGLMGHSYGGYATLSLVVQTKRFKAALVLAGTGDLMGLYGEMDTDGSSLGIGVLEGSYNPRMPGTPWEFRNLYIENSPIFYLDRVQTPLLMVHGTKDTTVNPFLADEVFVGLRRLGREAVYVKYVGEDHDFVSWKEKDQADLFHRIIEWFDKYLN